jgi:hypothetical protein
MTDTPFYITIMSTFLPTIITTILHIIMSTVPTKISFLATSKKRGGGERNAEAQQAE